MKSWNIGQSGHFHHHTAKPAAEPLPGFQEVQSQVFAGLYPVESHDYEALRDALEKLQIKRLMLR